MFRQTMNEAEALNDLALAQELRGDPLKAQKNYRAALSLSPGMDEAAANLEALNRDEKQRREKRDVEKEP